MTIKMVVEVEKGRENEIVEKWRPAMTTWREGGGEESPRGARETDKYGYERVRATSFMSYLVVPLLY